MTSSTRGPRGPGAASSRATTDTWSTALTHIEPNRILVRGYPLDEMMGRVTFGEAIHLVLTGELPTPSIARLVEAILVSFIDHGATPPSTLAARNTATTGASLRGCVGAGVLGFGRHHGGDLLACRALLEEGLGMVRDGQSVNTVATDLVQRAVDAHELPPPGFGHRFHTKDPRAARLLQLEHELEVDAGYTQLIRGIERALAAHPVLQDRPLPINVDGAAAAICGDIGFPAEVADALLLISRIPGLTAHALEEQRREAPMRTINPTGHEYKTARRNDACRIVASKRIFVATDDRPTARDTMTRLSVIGGVRRSSSRRKRQRDVRDRPQRKRPR